MSWWNSLSDLGGDLSSIAHGRNPTNQAPPTARPTAGAYLGGGLPMAAGTGQQVSADDPSDASSNYWDGTSSTMGDGGDGGFDWGSLGGGFVDALKAGGSAVASWVAAHPKDVLALVSAYSQSQRQGKADGFANAGLALTNAEYNDPTGKAALRTAGTAGMLNPHANTPDLSNLQTLAGPKSANPFATALPMAPLNHPPAPTPAPAPLPLASSPAPLQGIAGLPMAGGPMPPSGTSTGTPPTIPNGMKPPAGWTPPQPLKLAQKPTLDPTNPNGSTLPYAS